jgi:hypothetical protein
MIMLAFSAGGLLIPSIEDIVSVRLAGFGGNARVYFGFLDLFLAFALLLGATSAYPVIRFRAALGVGFSGHYFLVRWAGCTDHHTFRRARSVCISARFS